MGTYLILTLAFSVINANEEKGMIEVYLSTYSSVVYISQVAGSNRHLAFQIKSMESSCFQRILISCNVSHTCECSQKAFILVESNIPMIEFVFLFPAELQKG